MHFLTLSTKEGISLNNPGIARLYLCCLCSVLTGFGSNWLACNTPPPERVIILQIGSRWMLSVRYCRFING